MPNNRTDESGTTRTSEQPKKPIKARLCRICRQEYAPRSMSHTCCSIECSVLLARQKRDSAEKSQKKAERAAIKARKEKIKRRGEWMQDAQRTFNLWVRRRDHGMPCICCGKAMDWNGNKVDSGHYRSTGSAPHMRFVEDNAHAQDKQCNRFGAGRAVDYRIGLVARIGLDRVEALEVDQEPRHYSIDDLKNIIKTYRAKLRELLRASA